MSGLQFDSTGTIVNGYSGDDKCVAIPEGTVEIGRWAFMRNFSIEAVSLPSTLQTIGECAFRQCTKLKAVEIPASVKHIQRDAFSGCEELSNVVFNEGLEVISSSAFEGCKSLTDVILPKSLKTMYNNVFSFCDGLLNLTVLGEDTELGCNSFADCMQLKKSMCSIPSKLLKKEYPFFVNNSFDCYSYLGIGDENGCIINDGILIHHVGGRAKVYVTEGVSTIGRLAFFYPGHDERKPTVIHMPNTVRKVEPGALGMINIEVDQTAFVTTDKLVKEFATSLGTDPEAVAYSILFQSGKNWTEAVEHSLKNMDAGIVANKTGEVLSLEQDKCTDTVASRAVSFFAVHRNRIDHSAILKLGDVLSPNSSKWKKAKKAFDNTFGSIVSDVSVDDNSENKSAKHQELSKSRSVEKYVEEHYNDKQLYAEAINSVKKGVHYCDSKDELCSIQALILLLNEYVDQFYNVSHEVSGTMSVRQDIDSKQVLYKSEIADTIADSLNKDELIAVLKKLAFGRDYRKFVIAYARYGSEADIKEYCIELNKKKRGNSKEKYQAANMLAALYISDTAAAFEYIEKYGDVNKYSSMRGMTPDEYRNVALVPNFGMDENGICKIPTEEGEFSAYVDNKLSLTLLDPDGNILKSMPKKAGSKAQVEYAELKKNVEAFIKSRRGDIAKLYLRNDAIDNNIWMKSYAVHPVLKRIAQAVIWRDEAKTSFMITDDGYKTIDGTLSAPVGGVKPVHVLDMQSDEIEKWQELLQKENKSLIIDQVWEPIIAYDSKKLKSRYSGLEITNKERSQLRSTLKKKGVDVKADSNEGEYDHRQGTYVFSETNKMNLGSSMVITYHIDENTKNITFGSDLKLKRNASKYEVNTILLEMDRISVKSNILKDEPENINKIVLDGFTAAQIVEFIDYAIDNKSTNCNAVLQDYKNSKYPKYDAFSEFVLD